MIDLSTTYMGIKLRNPLVASSSPLCRNIGNIKRMEDAGLAAVVLQSLFEEQVLLEQRDLNTYLLQGTEHFAESLTYLPDFGAYRFAGSDYLEQIRKAKEAVDIPVIGSLNGVSSTGWVKYAREIQEAGADGLELNIYYLPTNPAMTSQQVERNYIALVREVSSKIGIPVAVKLGFFLSSIPNMIAQCAGAGASAVVMFNRFYQPDLDLTTLKAVPNLTLSSSQELRLRIRWTGILYKKVDIDMAVTGGVHTPEDVLKCVASGAQAAMMTSALLIGGIPHATSVIQGVVRWLGDHEYESLHLLRGTLSRECVENPEAFERANYMQVLGSYTNVSETMKMEASHET
jgi:dihydroorotate dehydrogenase (fumarate)